jgi:hypothetical protein
MIKLGKSFCKIISKLECGFGPDLFYQETIIGVFSLNTSTGEEKALRM